jgi:hypothetical protein
VCEELEEFMKWYHEVVDPRVKAYRKHAATCPECLSMLLSRRDELGLAIITATDEEILARMSKGEGIDETKDC